MERYIIVFVDDKRLYANNWRVKKPKLINAQPEHTGWMRTGIDKILACYTSLALQ